MVSVLSKKILKGAQEGKYSIGAFNTNNLEITQAIINGAKKLNSPVIIQTTPSAIDYAGLSNIFLIVKNEIESQKASAFIHLDHAKDFETVRQAVEIGYPSVMIDGSQLSFEENIQLTRRVVNFAHTRGVAVEGELGAIGKGEGGAIEKNSSLTDPSQAAEFVKRTGIDSLAVSIGNAHGAPTGEKIDLELLSAIADKVNIPLVLHGSSGLKTRDLKMATTNGICKVNIDTNIRTTVIEAMKIGLKKPTKDYRDILSRARDEVEKIVEQYIKILGSAEKAKV